MNIERAIETVRQFNEKKSAPQDLERSIDLLSAYTTALPRIQDDLALRILETARKYNERVREQETPPASIKGILRELYSKISGKKPLGRHEIYIPTGYSKKIFDLKPAAVVSGPKQSELDLFKTKALSLLVEQGITFSEALSLIQSAQINSSFIQQDGLLQLEMLTSRLPGCEVHIKGSFQRDPFHPKLALPIKSSFEISSHSAPTGFPHPSQYIGHALHDLLIPTCLLRPKMCPKFSAFLEEKRALAIKLQPDGALFKKAQEHLYNKRALFNSSHELFLLVQKLPLPHNVAFGPRWFDELSELTARYAEEKIVRPIHRLQEEWLLKQRPELFHSYEACRESIPFTHSQEAMQIHLMQLSEHLNLEPQPLSRFERAMFTSLFRQQLIFAHELEHALDPVEIIQQEIALFENRPLDDPFTLRAQELVQELLQYYSVRFETL